MRQGQYEVDVLVHGHSIREYRHGGQTFVEGREGSGYKVRVRNHSGSRILAVVTVDGLSVMDGEEGDLNGGGYVIDPYDAIEIPGWRLDNSEVARFQFGKRGRSYAAKIGKPRNIGVIGCAIFKEKPQFQVYPIYPPPHEHHHHHHHHYHDHRPWPRPHNPWWPTTTPIWTSGSLTLEGSTAETSSYTCDTGPDHTPSSAGWDASPWCGSDPTERMASINAVNDAPPQSIGTEFGEAQSHRVVNVGFNREASPIAVFELLYDDRRGLRRRGIDLSQRAKVSRWPRAFPRSGGCQPPPGWRG